MNKKDFTDYVSGMYLQNIITSEVQPTGLRINNVTFPANLLTTLRNLDESDRDIVVRALISEFIMGESHTVKMNGMQNLIYFMVADTLRRSNKIQN